jgi:hypothetical protein
MIDVFNKICRENQNILCSITFFPKIAPFMRWFPKNIVEPKGPKNDVKIWHIRVECWVSKATRTDAHHTSTHEGTHTYAPTRKHTQTNMCHVLVFHSNNDSRTRHSVTSYVNCLSCWAWFMFQAYAGKKNRSYHYASLSPTSEDL